MVLMWGGNQPFLALSVCSDTEIVVPQPGSTALSLHGGDGPMVCVALAAFSSLTDRMKKDAMDVACYPPSFFLFFFLNLPFSLANDLYADVEAEHIPQSWLLHSLG